MPACALDTRARSGIHRSTLYYQIPLATLSLGATDSFPGSHARCVCATRVRDSAPSTGPVVHGARTASQYHRGRQLESCRT
jgi:hypothetical protein